MCMDLRGGVVVIFKVEGRQAILEWLRGRNTVKTDNARMRMSSRVTLEDTEKSWDLAHRD